MKQNIVKTGPWSATLCIRLAVGIIFLSEGIQKFLFAEELGSGRFEKIGIPAPGILGPGIGSLEIIGGCLVLLGLYTRIASLWLFLIMCVAITTTKIVQLSDRGFWMVAHDARTDFSMLLSTLFLLISGAGRISVDFWLRYKSGRM
jgi:putative oxidoreductase